MPDIQIENGVATFPALDLLFTPQQSAKNFVLFQELLRKAGGGIPWGVDALDEVLLAQLPGDATGVIGRQGSGKTAFLTWQAAWYGEFLRTRKRRREAVVYISLEQSVEEIEYCWEVVPDYSITDVRKGIVPAEDITRHVLHHRAGLPIYTMGHSMVANRKRIRMTSQNILETMFKMEEVYGVHPAYVMVDYVQILPVEKGESRAEQVGEAIHLLKELAKLLRCPILIGVQASRSVDRYQEQIPTAADCQWASAIEQVCDKLIALWRPVLNGVRTVKLKEYDDMEIQVTNETMVIRVLKQRFGEAGMTRVVNFAPQFMRMSDLELNKPPLEERGEAEWENINLA